MTKAAISIQALSKVYRGKKLQKVTALDNLTLDVSQGQVFGFLGPNGAGKSTTIKILTGQIKPTGGAATLFDISVGRTVARHNLGYLPENPSFYDFLSAREYLHFVGKIFFMSESTIKSETNRVLELLNLVDAANRPIKSYSKGMVQRLGVAQAILHNPDLYILDEPMSGLDPIGRALVKDIILDLKKQGKTVFFSTHITTDVELVCDSFAILNHGVLQARSEVEDVMAGANSAYTVIARNGENSEVVSDCAEKELTGTIQSLVDAGCRVERVIPQRHSLEEFFLDTIHKDDM